MQNSLLTNALALSFGIVVTHAALVANRAEATTTTTITRPNYDVTCSMTKPGFMYIRVGGQTVTRRYSPTEVCSVYRNGTESVTTTK